MKSIEYLYNLVEQSNFTTIGYNFQDEKLKDEFISRLPIFRLKELGSSFSFNNIKQLIKQKVREKRLDCLFNDSDEFIDSIPNFEYLVIDIEDIPTKDKDKDNLSLHRSIQLRNIIEMLRSDSIENNYKVIFTSTTYKSMDENPINRISGASSPIYLSDLVIMFNDEFATIVKNRFGFNDEIVSLNELK